MRKKDEERVRWVASSGLPYDFDLLFDIKDVDTLYQRLYQMKTELALMEELIEEHKIVKPKGM